MSLLHVSESPHVRSKNTTQRIMLDVFIALIPASAFGVYNFGVPALIRLLVGIFACVAFEAIYQKAMKKKVMVGDMCCRNRSSPCHEHSFNSSYLDGSCRMCICNYYC